MLSFSNVCRFFGRISQVIFLFIFFAVNQCPLKHTQSHYTIHHSQHILTDNTLRFQWTTTHIYFIYSRNSFRGLWIHGIVYARLATCDVRQLVHRHSGRARGMSKIGDGVVIWIICAQPTINSTRTIIFALLSIMSDHIVRQVLLFLATQTK